MIVYNWGKQHHKLDGSQLFNSALIQVWRNTTAPSSTPTGANKVYVFYDLFGALRINWKTKSNPQTVSNRKHWYFLPADLFGARILQWYTFKGSGTSTGPLQLLLTGLSWTVGVVQDYNDGVISVIQFNVNDPQAVKKACIGILNQTGIPGRTYKLSVYKNGKLEFTVKSVYWGTQQTWSEQYTNDQLINQSHILQPNN